MLAHILSLAGPSLPRSSVVSLRGVIKKCCEDLLPSSDAPIRTSTSNDKEKVKILISTKSSTNADAFARSSESIDRAKVKGPAELTAAAWELLPILLSKVPTQFVKFSLRAQMDRTAILTGHKTAMLASVLSIPQGKSDGKAISSILPHLARAYGEDLEVEALLRPRMPVLRQFGTSGGGDRSDADSGADDEDEMMEDEDSGKTRAEDATNHDRNDETASIAVDETLHRGINTRLDPGQAQEDKESARTRRKRPRQPPVESPPPAETIAAAASSSTSTQHHSVLTPHAEASADTKRIKTGGAGDLARTTVEIAAVETVQAAPLEAIANEDDDSDSFEIPELIMDADTDEEGEERERSGEVE